MDTQRRSSQSGAAARLSVGRSPDPARPLRRERPTTARPENPGRRGSRDLEMERAKGFEPSTPTLARLSTGRPWCFRMLSALSTPFLFNRLTLPHRSRRDLVLLVGVDTMWTPYGSDMSDRRVGRLTKRNVDAVAVTGQRYHV